MVDCVRSKAVWASYSPRWKTVAIEQQGHARTADLDRPLTFDQIANDTAALLRTLKINQADFFGYSDGGTARAARLRPRRSAG
jgi:pimeloyl-ACP methyl ester carboxylesterase